MVRQLLVVLFFFCVINAAFAVPQYNVAHQQAQSIVLEKLQSYEASMPGESLTHQVTDLTNLDENQIPFITYQATNSPLFTWDEFPETWQPVNNAIALFSFFSGDHWLRFRLINRNVDALNTFIEIPYSPLDHVEAYVFSEDGRETFAKVMGDQYVFMAREVEHHFFLMPLTLRPNQHYSVYLRVHTDGLKYIPVNIKRQETFLSNEVIVNQGVGVFYGILLTVALGNIVIMVLTRHSSFMFLAVFTLLWISVIATFSGLSYHYLWPQLPQIQRIALAVAVIASMVLTGTLCKDILRLRRDSPFYRLVTHQWKLVASLFLLVPFLPLEIIYIILVAAILFTQGSLLVVALIEWRKKSFNAGVFSVAWLLILALVMYMFLLALGVRLVPVQPIHMITLTTAPVFLLLTFAVVRRYLWRQEKIAELHGERQTRIKLAGEYHRKEMALQREAQEELESLVSERTFELEVTLRELEEKNSELEAINMTDALTGIYNRRYFDKRSNTELRRSWRTESSLCLLMIDIDHFKHINDTYGHLVGDHILKDVAKLISSNLKRTSDVVCRYGGEEFAIILPDTSLPGALALGEELRAAIESKAFTIEGLRIDLTISVGLHGGVFAPRTRVDDIIARADKALYWAKENGRNQVAAFSEIEAQSSIKDST